ncbi:MAG: 2-phosphosulfolactate phosphatase [Thermoguttaceae bacterium]|nr:2-phosphosulfolactate phosphatase [Thermoguttaceae bacterium]MDW8079008.1 2-phosphosulfolactate phosphatase [Thermoguttaceae bacterium]
MTDRDAGKRVLNVYALPNVVDPAELEGDVAVVVDVLRACTTIVYALASGAKEIVPCLEVSEALERAARLGVADVLLGGERQGFMIDGFDLGNSPGQYRPEIVSGKTVVFTTTNGTRAMDRCRRARRVYLAGFVNVSAVCERLMNEHRVHIVCAGTKGEFSRDDILLAGLIVEKLAGRSGETYSLNAQAITARENWREAFPLPCALGAEPIPADRLAQCLRQTAGGKNVIAVGCEEDVYHAAEVDRFDIVPELDTREFVIRIAPKT